MKEYFEKKFGQGTAFDLDYGKLLIIALLILLKFDSVTFSFALAVYPL